MLVKRLTEKNFQGDLVVQPVQLDQEVHASSLDMFYQVNKH